MTHTYPALNYTPCQIRQVDFLPALVPCDRCGQDAGRVVRMHRRCADPHIVARKVRRSVQDGGARGGGLRGRTRPHSGVGQRPRGDVGAGGGGWAYVLCDDGRRVGATRRILCEILHPRTRSAIIVLTHVCYDRLDELSPCHTFQSALSHLKTPGWTPPSDVFRPIEDYNYV